MGFSLSFALLFFLICAVPPAPLFAQEKGAVVPSSFAAEVSDFEQRRAFDVMGPPVQEGVVKARAETKLYMEMVERFDAIAYDEDDFSFVAEAFSVPVDVFRPASLRAYGETGSTDVFDDDPLPGQTRTSSIYVDHVRLSFMPGGPLHPRNLDDVKLGNSDGQALFTSQETPKPLLDQPVEETEKAEEKKTEGIDVPKAANAPERLGLTNMDTPANAQISPDEQTLIALQKAVKDLGLEKQLNFDPGRNPVQTSAKTQKQEDKALAHVAKKTRSRNANKDTDARSELKLKKKKKTKMKAAAPAPAAEVAAEVAAAAKSAAQPSDNTPSEQDPVPVSEPDTAPHSRIR